MCLYRIHTCPSHFWLSKYLNSERYHHKVDITRCAGWRSAINPKYNIRGSHDLCPDLIIRHGLSTRTTRDIVGRGFGRAPAHRGCRKCWKSVYEGKWLVPVFIEPELPDPSDCKDGRESAFDYLGSDDDFEDDANSEDDGFEVIDEDEDGDDDFEVTDAEEDEELEDINEDEELEDEELEDEELEDEELEDEELEDEELEDEELEDIKADEEATGQGAVPTRGQFKSHSTLDMCSTDDLSSTCVEEPASTSCIYSGHSDSDTKVEVQDSPLLLKKKQGFFTGRSVHSPTRPSDALQRRRDQMVMDLTKRHEKIQSGQAPPQSLSEVPTSATMEGELTFAKAVRESPGKPPLDQHSLRSLRQHRECVDSAQRVSLKEHDAATKTKTSPTIDETGEQEAISAVQDRSYKTALSKLFANPVPAASSSPVSLTKKNEVVVDHNKRNLRKRPRLIEDATYVEADMLRDEVKRLREENITFNRRCAGLLEENDTLLRVNATLLQDKTTLLNDKVALLEDKAMTARRDAALLRCLAVFESKPNTE